MITVNAIVEASHYFVARHVKPGDVCIDATAGNGHDTLFLAGLAGEDGLVHSFDIQEAALAKTEALLSRHEFSVRVRFHLRNHKDVAHLIPGPVQAAMFNLGYLPGGDKAITTSAQDSVAALESCLELLAPGGIISIVTYSGHPGGREEEEAVAAWCRGLEPREFSSSCYQLVNKINNPPKLWLVEFC